jgi:hypothetical protein
VYRSPGNGYFEKRLADYSGIQRSAETPTDCRADRSLAAEVPDCRVKTARTRRVAALANIVFAGH